MATEYETRFPKRSEHTRWMNAEPITELERALYWFVDAFSSSTEPSHLRPPLTYRGSDAPRVWEFVECWASEKHGHTNGGENHYQIDQELAARMFKERFVEPFLEKGWGYTRQDNDRLVLSQKGRAHLEAHQQSLCEKARTFIVPGVHTDLTGELKGDSGCWLERNDQERWYCRFWSGDRVITVFPETGEVEVQETKA